MTIDLANISQYFAPAVQFILILALFWVAGLFMVLDKKLNAMRQGTDGIKNTITELNGAIERAQNAIIALKTNSQIANDEIAKQIDEANKAVETLKFAASAVKAVNYSPKSTLNNDLKTHSDYKSGDLRNTRRDPFDDLPPIDNSRRNVWGGLR